MAILAETASIAEEIADKIYINFEELNCVTNVIDALERMPQLLEKSLKIIFVLIGS